MEINENDYKIGRENLPEGFSRLPCTFKHMTQLLNSGREAVIYSLTVIKEDELYLDEGFESFEKFMESLK